MTNLAIQLDPSALQNPNLDIRYTLPDLLAERSGGVLADNGYDYAGEKPFLVVFLTASDLDKALPTVLEVIDSVRVLYNDLREAAIVGVEQDDGYRLVYPPSAEGRVESALPFDLGSGS